jgi:hypothetical protein
MQSKEYLKNKARKFAKQTWAGPGKFGVFIVLCIMIVAAFESVGLSNREKNLELRTVKKIVMPLHESRETIEKEIALNTDSANSETVNELLKLSTQMDFEKKNMERENILLFGAVDQYLFEHQGYIANYESLSTTEDKQRSFMSLLLKKSDEIVALNSEDVFILDF